MLSHTIRGVYGIIIGSRISDESRQIHTVIPFYIIFTILVYILYTTGIAAHPQPKPRPNPDLPTGTKTRQTATIHHQHDGRRKQLLHQPQR